MISKSIKRAFLLTTDLGVRGSTPLGRANFSAAEAATRSRLIAPYFAPSEPYSGRREGDAGGFLHMIQRDRADHGDQDRRDAGSDEVEHRRPPFRLSS